MTHFSCRALLFDMDGTLLDSSLPVRRVWRAWAIENNLDVDLVLRTMPGRRALEVMQLLAPHLPQPATVDAFLAFEETDNADVIAIPGAAEFLTQIPAGRWAVVTSATTRMARARLQAAGLPQPGVLIGADRVQRGKPHPEAFLTAAAALDVPPEECLVFEDAVAGIQAARAASMAVLGLTTHESCATLAADACLPDYTRLSLQQHDLPGMVNVVLPDAV
jgi:sugar-phosphatase